MSDQQSSAMAPTQRGTPARARRYDPWSMLSEMDLMLDRMFGNMLPSLQAARRNMTGEQGWAPLVDMYEEGNNLVVKAELPGVAKDDIDVSIDQGDLVIKGERKSETERREGNYYRMERSFGSFYRRLPLPEGIQPDQVSATYNDGVLEVRIPKPQPSEQSATKIQIS